MSTEKGRGVRDRGTSFPIMSVGLQNGEAQKLWADGGFHEGHAEHLEPERRPCQRISWNPKA